MLDKVKDFLNKFTSPLQAAVLYVGCTILDTLTSMHFPPGAEESNPFARHADGSFWLWHSVIKDSIFTVEAIAMSFAAYAWLYTLDKKWAKLAAGLPWAYFAWGHLDAAFMNILISIPGLYQMTAREMLRQLMGGR